MMERPVERAYRGHMATALITGTSSGFGLETARLFAARGWDVVATVRASGPVDVLVNNAGIGAFGAFEATPLELAREVFETNTFGVMAMTQAMLPHFRARKSG